VNGPLLNGLGILLGALVGLSLRRPLSARTQAFCKSGLGAFTIFYGFRLIYENLDLPFANCLKQLSIGFLGVVAGFWLGRLLKLQSLSNRIGHQASLLLAAAQKKPPGAPAAGFLAATALFCAAPLGWIGTVVDALQNYYFLLLLKAIMDGLAMMTFVKMFRWPVALAALPVFFFFNGLGLLIQAAERTLPNSPVLIASAGVAAGIITSAVALVILEVRRVELANYLPGLVIAPLLAYWFG
jgi:uncharacterized membrane protein YqgA involved in biofilm formation